MLSKKVERIRKVIRELDCADEVKEKIAHALAMEGILPKTIIEYPRPRSERLNKYQEGLKKS